MNLVANHPVELSFEHKADAMARAIQVARDGLDKRDKRKLLRKQIFVFSLAIVLLVTTGYIGIDTWVTNRQVQAQTTPLGDRQATNNNKSEDTTTNSVAFSGNADSSERPINYIETYKVAADSPRVLSIPSLGIKSRIVPLGRDATNSVEAPNNIYDTGWYNESAVPGSSGAALIDGHSSELGYGVFGQLPKIKVGASIGIEMGDGTIHNYSVAAVEIVPFDKVDMQKVLQPYNSIQEGLNIMTCTGKWISDKQTLDHRIIVYTIPQ